jgi:hypothetical protein
MKPVSLVTIVELIPIFKEGVQASSIEIARVKDVDGVYIQYDIVVGKGLHQIGGQGIYIQPDYTIPLNELFLEYHAPFGEPKNSRLGKKGRVRAIKFNLSFENSTEPIYSNGILVPWSNFLDWFSTELDKEGSAIRDMEFPLDPMFNAPSTDPDVLRTNFLYDINFNHPEFPWMELMGVEKYVADEPNSVGGNSGLKEADRPYFLYKTDEETVENHKRSVDHCYEINEVIAATTKRDGQSITVFTRKDLISDIHNEDGSVSGDVIWEQGICSRDTLKKLDQRYVSSYKDGEVVLHKYFHPELKVRGWMNDQSREFYTEAEAAEKFEPIMEIAKDNWVDTCKRDQILDKLLSYCQTYDVELALRGEIIGAGVQNKKNNYDSKLPERKIIWFGIDDLSSGVARRIHYGQEHNLIKVCEELGLEYTQELFRGVFSYDEIIKKSKEYFNEVKEKDGKLVEGVVWRSVYSNSISLKKLNDEYDSKA